MLWFVKRLVLASSLFAALLPLPTLAASSFPQPNFTQLVAGETQGGAGIQGIKCDPDADGVTCHLVVDISSGGGGGSAGSIGAAGSNGTTAQSVQGITGGVPVPVSGTLTTTFPYSFTADAQTATAASAIGLVGLNASSGSAERIRTGAAGTAITGGTAGVLYTQGTAAGGATSVVGTITANAGTGTYVTQTLGSSSGTGTSVTVTSTSTQLLAANASRVQALFYNACSVTEYLALGFTPTTAAYTVPIPAGTLFEPPLDFRGAINAITASTSCLTLITELT